MNIGHIECGATACADDITLNCTDPTEAQIMLNMAYNYGAVAIIRQSDSPTNALN